MFFILGRILMFLIIVLIFVGIISFVYNRFFKAHLVDDIVEDIVDEATEKRMISEAKKAANNIEFGNINKTKEDSDEGSA